MGLRFLSALIVALGSGSAFAFAPQPVMGTALEAPAGAREFTILYEFDRLSTVRHATVLLDILDYAEAVNAQRIAVEGHRGASLLADGSVLSEQEGLAERRAQEIAELLTGAGFEAEIVDVAWTEAIEMPDGVEDWRSRRTIVLIEP